MTAVSIAALLVILAVCGIASYLLSIATFIDEPFKGFIKWVLIAVAVVAVAFFAFGLIGVGPGLTFK